MKDYLQPAAGSTSQDTGSSDIQVMGTLPIQSPSRSDIRETGSLEGQTADKSEVAIITSSAVECTSAHIMIYPNSGLVDPLIIIENKSRQLPVMNLDVAEATGSLERGDHGATATTGVAGAEQTTRTGCQYTQIPRTYVEPAVEEVKEVSRECNSERTLAPLARYTDLDEKGPVEQDSFAKLLAEIDWEIGEEVDIEFGDQLDLGSDRDCSVLEREVAKALLRDEWDVWTDHPTSALGECCEEILPTEFSRDTQEVPDGVAEPVPKGLTSGIPLPAADESHHSANSKEEKEKTCTPP